MASEFKTNNIALPLIGSILLLARAAALFPLCPPLQLGSESLANDL